MYRRRSDIWFKRTLLSQSAPVTVEGWLVLLVGLGAAAGLFALSLWLSNSGLPGWFANVAVGLFVADLLATWFLIATHTGSREEIEGSDLVDNARQVLRGRRDS